MCALAAQPHTVFEGIRFAFAHEYDVKDIFN